MIKNEKNSCYHEFFLKFLKYFEKNFVYICLHKKIRKNPIKKFLKYSYEFALLKILNKKKLKS